MRHPLVPALLVVLALLGFAAGSAVVTSAATATTAAPAASAGSPTISGTVTYPNGTAGSDAYILVGSYALFEKSSPDRLRKIARDDPQDVTVIRPDDDGTFSVDAEGEAVVAVSDSGVSDVHRIDGDADLSLTLFPAKPLLLEAVGGAGAPGDTTILQFRLKNVGEKPVENLTVAFDLPEDWTVVNVSGNGQYDAEEGRITWSSVPSDGWAEATLNVRIPADADERTYEIPVNATSDTNRIDAWTPDVEVRESTPRPTETTTPVGGESHGGTPTATQGSTATDTPSPTHTAIEHSGEVPGFGPVAAVVALVAAALLARRQ